jgi:glycosyltransferase involved in cell wall biosynthesis
LINFISNLPKELRSGGFSALNTAAFAAVSKFDAVHYAGPINPSTVLWQKALSKLLRVGGSRGDFYFFSKRRLDAIAQEVQCYCVTDAQLDFFQGITPWTLTRPKRPYIALSDCTFRDYIDIFHRRNCFRSGDLLRIEQAECAWLRNARRVLFTSDWAAHRAIQQYALDASRVSSVGIFGEISLPPHDTYIAGNAFAFVATNFEAKGGRTVLAAFRELRMRHADATLVVVGEKPPDLVPEPGVEFAGFLRKEIPDEYARYRHVLGSVRAIVHPTRSDIAPLIVIESGYLGCPAVSSRRFAIPELIDDKRTGLLLDDPSDVKTLVNAMCWMVEHDDEYRRMRHAVWNKTRMQHSKQQFEERLLTFLQQDLLNA